MPKIRKIASHYLIAYGEIIPFGIVCLDDKGEVVGVERGRSIDNRAGVEFYDGIIMPGMVNAHCHLELSHMAGLMQPGLGYIGFARGMGQLRDASPQERLKAISYRDALMWQQGVQAVGDISNGNSTFEVKERSRIHYHTFVEIYGFEDNGERRGEMIYEEAQMRGLSVSVTPHSAYSMQKKRFEDAVNTTPDGLLSVHFMESAEEMLLFEGRGGMFDWYKERGIAVDFIDYGTPANRVLDQIPHHRKLMLVHNTMITQDDARKLADNYCDNLTWVLCAQSNKFITGERAPIDILRNSKCNIAVGTDSMASNHNLSMIGEMKALQEMGVGLDEIIEWCTMGGARALGQDNMLGSIKEGKKPGIVNLTGVDWQTMTLSDKAATKRIL